MDVYFLIKKLRWVLILLFINTLTFSVKAFFIFSLLIIDILLETLMHFQSGVEPVFIVLSVRPGIYLAINDHFFPCSKKRFINCLSSSSVHLSLVIFGSR